MNRLLNCLAAFNFNSNNCLLKTKWRLFTKKNEVIFRLCECLGLEYADSFYSASQIKVCKNHASKGF